MNICESNDQAGKSFLCFQGYINEQAPCYPVSSVRTLISQKVVC